MAIYIIDEIMGRGKTTAMINHINSSGHSERYIFITPYLTEVSRILEACNKHSFFEPLQKGGKLNNLKVLLKERKNIVSTHALFSMFDQEVLELVRSGDYTLIMDEVACVISKFFITDIDAEVITEDFVAINEDNEVSWKRDEYTGVMDVYKNQIEHNDVFAYSDNTWITMMPPSLFTSFKDVFLMTYMFEHQLQRCYFDLHELAYQRLYVSGDSPETFKLSTDPSPATPVDYSKLIRIVQNRKLNQIGDGRTALSKAWYTKNYKSDNMKVLKNNLYNFFRNYAKTPTNKNLWTVFCKDDCSGMDWRKLLSGKGYTKGFLSCNARGTNLYRDRTAAAYIVNRFPNTCVRNFLAKQGIYLDQDYFALSEMLQWIWRTAIRDGKEIYLYIPSKRMRNLLERWIVDVSKGEVNY